MSKDHQHPIRSAELHVFGGIGNAEGRFIARFYPYDTYPILFIGKTEDAARQAGEDFRAETLAKHEADFISRAAARDRMRAAKAAREARHD